MKIVAINFAKAHRELVKTILTYGHSVPTDYDNESQLPSLDLPVMIEVLRPWDPPIFSKCVWDTPEGLFAYRDELVYGTHNHLANKLGYTYHVRFENQLEGVMDELRRNPYSRRAQFITWQPEIDLGAPYPPCFQRGWFRLRNGALDFHTHWRSRDVLKAWGSNVFAFAHFHREWANKLELPVGVYREFIDSAHIYGHDLQRAKISVQRPIENWIWPLSEIKNDASPRKK